MSEKKIITINPQSFSFSNTTKKTKKGDMQSSGKIKMKQASPAKSKTDTLRKRSVLKMIRDQQSEQNKQQITTYAKRPTQSRVKPTDFDDAKNFFDNMTMPTKNNLNHTLKHPPVAHSPTIDYKIPDMPEININYPNATTESPPMHINSTKVSMPKYGCLKNGSLPTFRDYMNKTRKTDDAADSNIIPRELMDNYAGSSTFIKGNIMNQQKKLENMKKKKRKRFHKKIIRRTYKTGKSKTKPLISVLISNKTIRNTITTKKQLLQQVPLQDVRKYLMKHGFIKIGTITPNDVLRQMYEAALLICGEVQNHNSETLMYNFINNNDKL